MVEIRDAAPEDVPGVQRVARAGWHATYDDILGPEAVDRVVDDWYAAETVREYVTADDVVYLVADDGGIVGYASGKPDIPAAKLLAIYVDPDRWRKGIGARLFDAVRDRLSDRGYERLQITVLAENDVGRSFYEHNGFEAVERDDVELAGVACEEVTYAGPL